MWAAHRDDCALVERCSRPHANVDVSNDYGATPMPEAARLGDPRSHRGAAQGRRGRRDRRMPDGQTALMIVARTSNVEAAEAAAQAWRATSMPREKWRGQTALHVGGRGKPAGRW